ncbi:MAG: succinate dehydrogenase/fumarate reductase iron-sulfur subunit [Candidatus Micrarchaeales archaeon]
MGKDVRLKIFRQDPANGRNDWTYQEYTVPTQEGMVVLDAVNYVVSNNDSTLSVRWNCKAAKCGSCSAEINGVPKLMCNTRIDALGDTITVGPMRAFPLVKDLVTDVSKNFEMLKRIPEFTPRKAKMPWRFKEEDIERSKEFRKCIECFLCQDVCHVIRDHNTNYIGPRHVIKAASLDMHPMDSLDRSKMLAEENGLGYCNVTKCCEDVCPEKIKITDNAIIPEKERAADNLYDPISMLFKRLKGKVNGNK